MATNEAQAIPNPWKRSVSWHAKNLVRMKVPYKKDVRIKPDAPTKEGVDCSRFDYLAYKRGAVPGIRRTTSRRMALGLDNWTGIDVELRDADETDLVFWTWSEHPNEPDAHTGLFVVGGKSGLLEVAHASYGRGHAVIVPLQGKLIRDLHKVRRITIGEPSGTKK